MNQSSRHSYEFGTFRLDARERLLQRDGVTISLTPKAFDLLLALVERHGRLVEKEELFQAVWPDTTVEESNLSSNIALIRKALGDGTNGERYIETVPKRGYRFVAEARESNAEVTHAAKNLETVLRLQAESLQLAMPEVVPTALNGNARPLAKETVETPRLPRPERNWKIATGVFALLAVLALGVAYFKRSTVAIHAMRLAFAPPENVAFDNGLFDYLVISPDGEKLVFTGRSADGKRQLWVRRLNETEARLLPGTDNPIERPFWSPDSRSIGFVSQWKLRRVELAGGNPQTLCDASNYLGGTWGRAGVILFAREGRNAGLFQVKDTGGEPQRVTSLDPARKETFHSAPFFLPDGHRFLYRVTGEQLESWAFAGSLDSKEVKQVLAGVTPVAYVSTGWLLFVRDGALAAQSFDIARLELEGEAVPLTQVTNLAGVGGVPFSASENGTLIWQGNRQRDYQLVWFDREGKHVGTAGPPNKVTMGETPRLSPDGKQVAISRSDPNTRNYDLWAIDLAHNVPYRLTADPALEKLPLWSPDGRRMVFFTIRAGASGFYQKATSGVGNEELLLKGRGILPSDWSWDGRFIFYNLTTEKTKRDLWVLPLFGDRQPYQIGNSDFDEYHAQLSPDGRWLAYVSDEPGRFEVYVQPFTADGKLGSDKKRISISGGNHPRWRRDGQELFYVAADGQMMAVSVKPGGTAFEFETPKALFRTRLLTGHILSGIEYDVTGDGQRFLIGTLVGEPAPVSVILNWTAELKK